jgi:hypothetical protein
MDARSAKLFLPQFKLMLAQIESRPTIPADVLKAARELVTALERWIAADQR